MLKEKSQEKKTCVRCGKCLAVCPYYLQKRIEECSPRGRIVLQEDTYSKHAVYCLGTQECENVCPFDLSPLQYEKPGFIWEDVLIDGDDIMLSDLFDLIYNFDQKREKLKEKFTGKTLNDKLLQAWLKYRGLCVDNFNGDIKEFYVNGILYNPFTNYCWGNIKRGVVEQWRLKIKVKGNVV